MRRVLVVGRRATGVVDAVLIAGDAPADARDIAYESLPRLNLNEDFGFRAEAHSVERILHGLIRDDGEHEDERWVT